MKLFVAMLGFLLLATCVQASSQPNILLIYVDDQGFDYFYGHNAFQIPTNRNPIEGGELPERTLYNLAEDLLEFFNLIDAQAARTEELSNEAMEFLEAIANDPLRPTTGRESQYE